MQKIIFAFLTLTMLFSCRGEQPIIRQEYLQLEPEATTVVSGFYLLNEGNMNMNKASLDFYDYATGTYRRNIYEQTNPSSTLGLGDVGNDLGIYGSKLYAVINASNKVEVLDVKSGKRLKVIDIKNCRYITFHNGMAYVSAYDARIAIDPTSPNGFVAQIDTSSLEITNKVAVGRQPEQLAVVGNKLYVANSGGYSPNNYEHTVSVIDLSTFTFIKNIDVQINLHRLLADTHGDLYVSSRGDYYKTPSALFVIDTKTDQVTKKFDIPTSNITISGDTLYIIGAEFSYETYLWTINYKMIDTRNETILPSDFLSKTVQDMITQPYGMAVDPVSRDVFITDALDYISPGRLIRVDRNGNLRKYRDIHGVMRDWVVITGDIPAHFAYIYTTPKVRQ